MSDVIEYPKAERKQMRSSMRSLISFLPNLLKLLYRLMVDARVSATDKTILAATIIYVISPLDFIPDIVPFIGQVDDMYLVGIALLRMLNRTPEEVVQKHWDGGGDIKSLASTISRVAQFFLPRRVRNILVGEVERPAPVADFQTYAEKRTNEKEA
jgi:uncharacterized membrane protein YkvA (DUF1232 family)